jgi:hypothetical protein
MQCWICAASAQAVCRFCGRATCKEHARQMPFVFTTYRGKEKEWLMALAIEDAIYCGVCHPKQEPTHLDFLD